VGSGQWACPYFVHESLLVQGTNTLSGSLGHPENRVLAGCEGYFSHKNNYIPVADKLEKSSEKCDFWKEDRTDTLTKTLKNLHTNMKIFSNLVELRLFKHRTTIWLAGA
jgi:hypothetical protein